MKSKLLWWGGSLLALLVIAEVAARIWLGLGDPLLYVADPAVEYMLRPNQDVTRLGNHILVNRYGMRSPDFPSHKSSKDELRVLTIGDSLLNSGNFTDQSELATTRLQERLHRMTGRPVVVGNASAGSWGPANMLAWTRKFGFLESDVLIIALSSHDASDVPTFEPLSPMAYPQVKPLLALQEGVTNYLPRYFPWTKADTVNAPLLSARRPPVEAALQSLRQLVLEAEQAGVCVVLMQHASRAELADGMGPGYAAFKSVAQELGIAHLEDMHALADATQRNAHPYRDELHLSVAGQEILAQLLTQAVQQCDEHGDERPLHSVLSAVR